MEPISKGDEYGRGGSVYGQSEFAGWGAQPKLVPTVIVWAHGGSHVELEGSFDNWTQRHTMQRSGKDSTLVKLLPPGVYQVRRWRGVPPAAGRLGLGCCMLHAGRSTAPILPSVHPPIARTTCRLPTPSTITALSTALSSLQYKFIVDGQWRHDPNLPSMYDDMGNINNVLEVQVRRHNSLPAGLLPVPVARCCLSAGAGAWRWRVPRAALRVQPPAGPGAQRTRRAPQCGEPLPHTHTRCTPIHPPPQEYVPENLESLVGFDPPPSPPSRCACGRRRRAALIHAAKGCCSGLRSTSPDRLPFTPHRLDLLAPPRAASCS